MKEKDLKRILQEPYSFENWKKLLPLFFDKVEFLSKPHPFLEPDDRIAKGEQVGLIHLDDDKSLAIFDVEVTDKVDIPRNRKQLRDIAIKHIDQGILHGAIVFYHSPSQPDYRFSFIAKWSALDMETGELIKGETKPKRYTYLLGPNEACTTAAKRLLTLIPKKENHELNLKALQEVFSVEALNREFFKNYKEHYEKFWRYLAESPWREALIDAEKEEVEKQEKPIRDFVKKMLGRIVFLHFLQKKGWLGCPADSHEWKNGEKRFMQVLFEDFNDKEHFYSRCLTRLFFETLNTKRANDEFHLDGLEGKLNGSRVPYLNGGLFEIEKNKVTLNVDFPASFFRELLDFFEQYNFTIDENSPDDHEVGIDPEMLGHIFENLLEENKDKGAFYTPKEIVQFMCQESLIQYLYNHFGERKDIKDFVRQHGVSDFLADRDHAVRLNQLLDEIKVCDPAIGSGAFPIGMLQEIFEAKLYIYPYLKTNQPFDPAAVKKKIIQNSIYGVDIEKGAVDIARLRFWLALVVDEETPQPLPNLDYKIMQGNSLLEQFEGIDLSKIALPHGEFVAEPERDLFGNIKKDQIKMTFSRNDTAQRLKSLIRDFFTIEDTEQKIALRKEINGIVEEHILYNIELREQQLKRFIAEAGDPEKLNKRGRNEYEKYIKDLEKLQESKARLLKIQETDERPYFLWHLYFMDVFEPSSGSEGGFDVVIGNPPYIQLQKEGGKLANELKVAGYESFARTGDIYALFYEKGIQLLKEKGILCYITSNKWMRAGYGEKLRKFFLRYNPLLLIDLGPGIFESATVDTNILLIQKNSNQHRLKALALRKEDRHHIPQAVEEKAVTLSHLTADAWFIGSKEELALKEKIERIGKPLKDWDVNIYRGILTGLNKAFIIPTEKRNEILSRCRDEAERQRTEAVIRPILRGRDIKRYYYEWAGLWVIVIPAGWTNEHKGSEAAESYMNRQFPALMRHLKDYEAEAKKRYDQGNYWWELRHCDYYHEFEKEKVVWSDIANIPMFTVLPPEYYFNNTVYMLRSHNVLVLCGVLNSKLIRWYFPRIATDLGGKSFRLFKIFVERFPIPFFVYSNNSIIQNIENIVDNILAAKRENHQADTSRWEQEIDLLVYQLYDLSYDEVKIIDPNFEMSEEAYKEHRFIQNEK